jgi:predicted FMN-binding regulatory protein PaiB
MKDYPEFRARSREEIDELLASQRLGRLIAVDPDGWPQVGLHPYTWDQGVLEVHLVNSDEQLAALRGQTRAVFEVDDVLSAAPSHWLDEEDATNADHFYRCVILRGPMTLSNDIAGVESHLRRLLEKYQPERRYAPIDRKDPRYGKYMAALTLIRIEAQEIRTKFKLAQRTSVEDRAEIVRQLRERADVRDLKSADAIEIANSDPGAR